MTMATVVKTQQKSNVVEKSNGLVWLVVTAILVLIGAIAWGTQLTKGASVLGIGQIITWGIYITAFFTLAGLASGLLALAVLADLDVLPTLKTFRRNLLIGSVAAYIAAGFMILMDLGKPQRVLNMILHAQIGSPFLWDFISLSLGVVLALVLLFVPLKGKWLQIIAAIVAGVVVVFEGLILSMSAGSPLWSGGIMPVIFLVEGFLVAVSVTLLFLSDKKLTGWAATLLGLLFLLNAFEMAALAYAGDVDDRFGIGLVLANPTFWLMVVLGIILPFVLLVWFNKNRAAVIVAAFLAVLGVFVAKTIIVVAGQAISFLMGIATYTPTLVEIAGVVGVVGLAGLLYLLGTRFLPKLKA
jgi:molybdopterin-containing oxidoreductase family membrane subunit